MICPECGKEMEQGFVRADKAYLYWVERRSWTGMGGEVIGEVHYLKGAHLPAFRCQVCKLLMANYESYDEKASKLFFGSVPADDHGPGKD